MAGLPKGHDQTKFADSIFDSLREELHDRALNDIRKCKVIVAGDDSDQPTVMSGVLDLALGPTELVNVTQDSAVYSVSIEADMMLRVTDDPWQRWQEPPALTETLLKYRTSVFVDVHFHFPDGVHGGATFDFILPSVLDIDLSYAVAVNANEWIATRPVIVCGVHDGRVTENGLGSQRFSNISEAQVVFPDLDIWKGSKRFTHATGNKLGDELRFETRYLSDLLSK